MLKQIKMNQKHYYAVEYPTKDKEIIDGFKIELFPFYTKKERNDWQADRFEYRDTITAKNAYRIMNKSYIKTNRSFL